MDIDAMRKRNEGKAEEERSRGPVSGEPDSSPLGEAIVDFHERGALPFGIPAHRSGTGAVTPDAADWAGMGAFESDVGMNHGIDTRHQSWGVETTAMELFAQAVGADQTLFSTNGSSLNVHVAMLTVARPGEKIVMARNGHKSAFSALVLAGVEPIYVDPVYDDTWQVAHGVEPAALDAALAAHPDAKAAMAFTPTYYGYSADVAGLAEAAHAHGVPLVTDDAWGLDYSFCSRLPPSALESGADLAIGSVHKTLSGFAQTSVLSIQGDRIDSERLQIVFELEQSTSASALLISSIDAARRQFVREGEDILGAAIDRARRLRATVDEIPGLEVMPEAIAPGPGAFAVDPTHVCIDVKGLGLSGFSAADWLREHRKIHLELTDHRRVMALISFADDDQSLERLAQALLDLAEHHREADPAPDFAVPPIADLRLPTEMLPRDAFLGATEDVPWRQAAGRISAEMICPYPPGIPVCAPGERLSTEVVDYLEQVVAAGGMVEGAADEALETFRVVA
jgi:arginine decarboxylase